MVLYWNDKTLLMAYLGKHVDLENIVSWHFKTRREWLTKLSHTIMQSLLSPTVLLKLYFKPFFQPKRTNCTLQIVYSLMGKVIRIPGLSCCHIIHHNFQFKALICFYFIARVKDASSPGELSHAHYSFCAAWRSVPKWTVKSWKTLVWEQQKWTKRPSVPEILLVSSAFRKGSHCQVI